jgi:thioesterase domain-containing protein
MSIQTGKMNSLIERPFDFVARMGLQVIDLKPRRVKLLVPLQGNENHIGSMYAGALFTIAEIPGGALFLSTFDVARFYPVIKEMTIRFVKPARSAVTIEMTMSVAEAKRIEAEAIKNGKSEYVLEGQIKDSNQAVVAVSRGTYQLLAHQSGSAAVKVLN